MPDARAIVHIDVDLGPAYDVGPVPTGYRRVIPLRGGRFQGERLRGEVVAVGADWNLVRTDGVMTLSALYLLKTDDGVFITIHNEGMIRGNAGQMDEMTTGQKTEMATLYTRLKTFFEAPAGPYEWLNQSLFVGQLYPPESMGRVSMDIFENA